MTDEKNGEQTDAGQTPPPLVPPPVRRNDTGEQRPADRDQVRPIGSDQPVFVEPTTPRDDDRADSDDVGDSAARDDRPAGDDAAVNRTDDDSGPNGTRAYAPTVTDDAGRDDDSDDDLDRDEQPYRPVSARSNADDQAYAPVAARTGDDQAYAPVAARAGDDSGPRDTARQDVRETSADAETVAVTNPSTSPSAPPQPVFVPASDGGTERATGFPPATGQQREFVQPPVAPKKKGNRGIGSLIALLSVILFAVVYALIAAAIIAAQEPQSLTDIFTTFVVNPLFWVPSIIFVVAFIIVVLLANRATWWAYVLGSLLVGALVYFGTIGVALIGDNVFGMTPSDAFARFLGYVPNPFIIAAGLVAREVSLWTGSAIAARGRRMRDRNLTARDEYERASAEHRAEYERTYSPGV